jgi:hypothetical protein
MKSRTTTAIQSTKILFSKISELRFELAWDDDAVSKTITSIAKTKNSKFIYTAQGPDLLEWM